MSAHSTELRVADLVFEVYNHSVHPEWFSGRVHQRVSRPGWSCDLWLIPGGHVLLWAAGNARVTELVGALATPVPERGRLYHSRVRQEKSTRIPIRGGGCYQACCEAEQVEPAVFAHLHDELTLDATRVGLFHRIGSGNRLAAPALGHLRFECNAHSLTVLATHMFPHDRAIVRTQTLFEAP